MNLIDAVQVLQAGTSAGGRRSQQTADREERGEVGAEDGFSASGSAEFPALGSGAHGFQRIALQDVLDRIASLSQTLNAELAASVQQTGGRLAGQFVSGRFEQVGLMASFEGSIQRLMDVDPELVEDYLMLVDILLEEENGGNGLGRFLRAV